MSTPASLGLITPDGNDLIKDGDDAISINADVLASIYDQLKNAVDFLVIPPERTTFIVPSKNMYNPTDPDVVPAHALGAAGPTPSALQSVTGWIAVKAATTYTASPAMFVNVYDASKTLLSGQRYSAANAPITFTTTVDGWIRSSFITSIGSTFQIERGPVRTDYEPYGIKIPALRLPEPPADDSPKPTTPVPVRNPIDGFTIPVVVTRSSTGYAALIDHEGMHSRGAGKTLYVDPVSGLNSNDGLSWATAKKDPGNAVFDAGAYGVSEVIVKGGIYTRNQCPAIGRADLIVRAAPGTRPVFTQCDTRTDWAPETGSVHKVALTSTGVVFDLTTPRAPSGVPVPLTRVADLATCAATPGSTYYAAGTVYVHLIGGRAPDAQVLVSRLTYAIDTSITPGTPTHHLLYDGIEFWGGVTSRPRALADGSAFIARDCAWRWAGDNGLSVQGFAQAVLVGCEATHNGVDGFNYHDFGGRTGQVLEVACEGRLNGQTAGGSSQNGTTAHDNYKILRVGGVYEWNPGPNVADVNNVISANFGVYAGDVLGYAGVPDWDYTAPELAGQLYLIDCTSRSDQALRAGDKTVRVSGFKRSGVITGTGTLAPYN